MTNKVHKALTVIFVDACSKQWWKPCLPLRIEAPQRARQNEETNFLEWWCSLSWFRHAADQQQTCDCGVDRQHGPLSQVPQPLTCGGEEFTLAIPSQEPEARTEVWERAHCDVIYSTMDCYIEHGDVTSNKGSVAETSSSSANSILATCCGYLGGDWRRMGALVDTLLTSCIAFRRPLWESDAQRMALLFGVAKWNFQMDKMLGKSRQWRFIFVLIVRMFQFMVDRW